MSNKGSLPNLTIRLITYLSYLTLLQPNIIQNKSDTDPET